VNRQLAHVLLQRPASAGACLLRRTDGPSMKHHVDTDVTVNSAKAAGLPQPVKHSNGTTCETSNPHSAGVACPFCDNLRLSVHLNDHHRRCSFGCFGTKSKKHCHPGAGVRGRNPLDSKRIPATALIVHFCKSLCARTQWQFSTPTAAALLQTEQPVVQTIRPKQRGYQCTLVKNVE
jgi:hypothetical protein